VIVIETLNQSELLTWLGSDSFFEQPKQIPLKSHIDATLTMISSSSSHSLSKFDFLSLWSSLPRRDIKLLLIHLLHRTTNTVVKKAKLERKKSIVSHHRLSSSYATLDGVSIHNESLLQTEAENAVRDEQEEALNVILPPPPVSPDSSFLTSS